jgi:hypothetical protein
MSTRSKRDRKKYIATFKKVGIYFDDGDYSDGNSLNGFIKGDGDGNGKAVTHNKPRYKHGEILEVTNNFVYFLEDNGSFHMIPVFRIFRIQLDKERY